MIKFLKKQRALHALGKDGYTIETGWFESYIQGEAVDLQGEAIPWITYPAIDFIRTRLNKNMLVFEYGIGNSTFWWSKQVKEIDSVENNKEWFELINKKKPFNSNIYLEEKEGYYSKIQTTKKKYDIIFVDGVDRESCFPFLLESLSATGVIIWDDSFREQYIPSFEKLYNNTFRRVFFKGLSPINNIGSETSIFYRNNNCFNI